MSYKDKLKPVASTTPSYRSKLTPVSSTPAKPAENPFAGVAKDAINTLVYTPGRRFGEALGVPIAKALGASDEKLAEYVAQDKQLPSPFGTITVKGQKQFGEGGGKQIAANALKTSAALFPYARTAGLVGKVAPPLVANSAAGAAGGYLSDVGYALEKGKGVPEALTPGMGTALGAGIPLAGAAVQATAKAVGQRFSPQGRIDSLISNRRKSLEALSQAPLRKAVNKGTERGIDVIDTLSKTDVLHGAVDKTGTVTTKGSGGAIEQYTKEFVDGNESLVSQALQKEGRSIAPELVRKKLVSAINKSGIQGAELNKALSKIDEELAGYARRASKTGAIPLETLHSAKVDKYSNINFFTEGASKKYDKTIAKALKELVEEHTSSVDVKSLNKELAKHFAVLDYLEKLDGKKVAGGRLGKYFAQTVGAIVGSKLGPLGAIAGAEAGGQVQGSLLERVFRGQTGIKQPQAEAITKTKDFIKSPPLGLPAPGEATPLPPIILGPRAQSTIDAAERARLRPPS